MGSRVLRLLANSCAAVPDRIVVDFDRGGFNIALEMGSCCQSCAAARLDGAHDSPPTFENLAIDHALDVGGFAEMQGPGAPQTSLDGAFDPGIADDSDLALESAILGDERRQFGVFHGDCPAI